MTYYVDVQHGSDTALGTKPSCPLRTVEAANLRVLPGDTVAIARGSIVNGALHTVCGSPDSPVTYTDYGQGEKPTFCGAKELCAENLWQLQSPHVWRFTGELPSEPCNLIFNGGESCGEMRWQPEQLLHQGEWYEPGTGNTSTLGSWQDTRSLLLYSTGNPGLYYKSIACALWGERRLCTGDNLVLRNLRFWGSGVHGFASTPNNTTLQGCEFLYIGGAVWNRRLRIRFGNAVEFWDAGENDTVKDCLFYNIYDSCVTHQGAKNCVNVRNVRYENNLFAAYGMAAYELRDKNPMDGVFNGNLCLGAGEGFAQQGEGAPRQSEIYPQPMGHHLFCWRVEQPTPGACLQIKDNVFCGAPYGAAVYSICAPQAEKQWELLNNRYYTENAGLLMRLQGREYAPAQFDAYREATGFDVGSVYEKPPVLALVKKWMRETGNENEAVLQKIAEFSWANA